MTNTSRERMLWCRIWLGLLRCERKCFLIKRSTTVLKRSFVTLFLLFSGMPPFCSRSSATFPANIGWTARSFSRTTSNMKFTRGLQQMRFHCSNSPKNIGELTSFSWSPFRYCSSYSTLYTGWHLYCESGTHFAKLTVADFQPLKNRWIQPLSSGVSAVFVSAIKVRHICSRQFIGKKTYYSFT